MSQLAQPGSSVSPADLRPALTLLTGFAPKATREAADLLTLADPSLLVVTYDLAELLDNGTVRRLVHDGRGPIEDERVTLDHGCINCTIREDLLPALVRLARARPAVDLALVLPPSMEPEAVTTACGWCDVDGAPVTDAIRIDSVVAVCDPGTLLETLDSDQDLADRRLQAADDDTRSVSEVAARQIEFADTVLLWAPDSERDYEHTRLSVLLQRLNPWARHLVLDLPEPAWLSARIRRSGRFDPEAPEPHGRGLEGYAVGCHEPEPDCGVVATVYRARRPFHPERFHRALPTLAGRTLRGRGHLWLAGQPDTIVAWESSGGGVSMGDLGRWLAATPDEEWEESSPERRVNADLHWDADFGDRGIELAFVGIHFAADELAAVLDACLLTDAEAAEGAAAWREYPDPFDGCFDSKERNQE
ncbi:CobW family GTP-binding protein [Glycomyces algeriensis]|uniref:GTP-binding protein n=1 Tax=Glycomyces algeriensis TaxID=256037 RepID=A0A9W6G819_9ACTN|nr:GTP-binding protein [Glycomyces algeriensis]MDA1367956.1 GTP-binding protein [Glycomyces algeriensis]MDR7349495.1 G3E family GTPase [Glycomyces algeriensis]GLI42201.1 GTP-binding protein [Glycomyces algeriensis]